MTYHSDERSEEESRLEALTCSGNRRGPLQGVPVGMTKPSGASIERARKRHGKLGS